MPRRENFPRLFRWPRALLAAPFLLSLLSARAETGHDAWLRYAPIQDPVVRQQYNGLGPAVVVLQPSEVANTAAGELIRGVHWMLGRTLRKENDVSDGAIVLGTIASLGQDMPQDGPLKRLKPDGFLVKSASIRGHVVLLIAGADDRGLLYGVFAVLRRIAMQQPLHGWSESESPYAAIRWTNEWDNLDGSVERGYGGHSIFFADGEVQNDLTRVREYARLLASVGINGCVINNVNADPRILSSAFIPQLTRIAAIFRPWGIRLSVAADFASPKKIGGLETFDPVEPRVAAWWREKADEIYRQIPDFGGFLIKADSEGILGPSVYKRTHAQGANVIARALKPHGGIVVYRAFVYDHHLDWANLKNDRARAAYDNFAPLDGQFDSNVVVQIKYGPIDFQVREPVSPLIGALQHTNQALELQITQEYTGQQRHLCFLVPMWKEVLNFDLRARAAATPVNEIVSGSTFKNSLGGFVGVANLGTSENWLGYDLAQANLYGFGRLAWNPNLTAPAIAEEWTRLTFGNDPLAIKTVVGMQMDSWPAYEKYTGSPLGLQTLTNIVGTHYGPGPESADGNGWGQWIRADSRGIGMDRTAGTGTGFVGQYSPAVAGRYENLKTCPDNLLLFFHHVPYDYLLHSGETVIQTIYDTHYEGARKAQTFYESWKLLQGHIDPERFEAVSRRLEYQAGHAIVWRDAITEWFFRLSSISDAKGRVGHHAERIEAESMRLQGYDVEEIHPWEAASNGRAVGCPLTAQLCSASFSYQGSAGRCDLAVQYFDQNNGRARFRLLIAGRPVAEWVADDDLPSTSPDADTSTRHTAKGMDLHPGDEIRIEGMPDGGENASLDYVEIAPAPQ
jgi:alpha-glucuronidase